VGDLVAEQAAGDRAALEVRVRAIGQEVGILVAATDREGVLLAAAQRRWASAGNTRRPNNDVQDAIDR